MANIMSMTKLKNRVSRNGFDLSRKNLFTAKAGEALPVACIECLPGDSHQIDMAWFTRTQPVNTAAYTRMREYYDWYFVPTNLLWNKFNTFVTQMTDNNQKANGINNNVTLSDEHPYMTFSQVANYVWNMGTQAGVRDTSNFFGFNRGTLTCKLLHYLDYGDFSHFLTSNPNVVGSNYANPKLNPFPLLAYQKIYQDFIRDSQWEKAYAPASNIDYMTGAAGTNNLPLSEIDYDNENMFDLRYYNWNKDYFMGLLPNSQYDDAASVITDSIGSPSVNWPSSGYKSWAMSLDPTRNDSAGNIASSENGYTPTTLATLDSAYYGDVDDNGQRRGYPTFHLSVSGVESLKSALGISSPQLTVGAIQSAFTILALRQAEAKQKWAEITQSQQQDYKSQIEAHFDVNVSDAYSDRCRYIGGVSGNIDIDPVVNQNLADENAADIAGRGQGGSRGSISFDTKVHGYLMCIYHCVPLLDYALDGIKRQNLKTVVTDYAIPEFDATGMVSVPLIELSSSFTGGSGADSMTTLLGYAPRYVDYKTGYDLVHGAFFNGGLDAWVAPIDRNYINEYLTSLGESIASGAFNYHFFKIPSSVLNPVFGVNVDSSVDSDQFLVNAAFDIKSVRNLDRNGLPY